MKRVQILKQWRGHDVGTTPELTDERADELIAGGFAELFQAAVIAQSVAVAEHVVENVPDVKPSPYRGIRKQRRTVDDDTNEAGAADSS